MDKTISTIALNSASGRNLKFEVELPKTCPICQVAVEAKILSSYFSCENFVKKPKLRLIFAQFLQNCVINKPQFVNTYIMYDLSCQITRCSVFIEDEFSLKETQFQVLLEIS